MGRYLDVFAAVLLVAAIYVLVRPRSKGADLINAVGGALSAIVRNATDLATTGG